MEGFAVLVQRTHRVDFWNLRKAMMLQMGRLKRVEVDKIKRTEKVTNEDVGLTRGEDIVMGQLMNNTIKVQVEDAQRHEKPQGKIGMPIRQCQTDRDQVQHT